MGHNIRAFVEIYICCNRRHIFSSYFLLHLIIKFNSVFYAEHDLLLDIREERRI